MNAGIIVGVVGAIIFILIIYFAVKESKRLGLENKK
jgi:hypothetical protein